MCLYRGEKVVSTWLGFLLKWCLISLKRIFINSWFSIINWLHLYLFDFAIVKIVINTYVDIEISTQIQNLKKLANTLINSIKLLCRIKVKKKNQKFWGHDPLIPILLWLRIEFNILLWVGFKLHLKQCYTTQYFLIWCEFWKIYR